MDLSLKDKVAIVTGTGSQIGFGKAIALTLAANGCHIIAVDINLDGAGKTAAEVKALGRRSIALKADVTKKVEIDDMVVKALAEFGRIDILVNNAGASTPPRPFLEMTEANCDADINNNLKGVINCIRAVLPQMIGQKYGKIVNIVSGAGLKGAANLSVYAAAKAGIISFTKSISLEMAHTGININCVAPGMALTGFAPNAPPGFIESFAERTVVGRLTTTQDVANMVAFFVSDVSSDIVGQTIAVEGTV